MNSRLNHLPEFTAILAECVTTAALDGFCAARAPFPGAAG